MASLKEHLRELANPNPTFEDPEDFINWTDAKLTEKSKETELGELDNQFGSLRHRLPTLLELDEKYHGKRVSRKDIDTDAETIQESNTLESNGGIDRELKELIEGSKHEDFDDFDEDAIDDVDDDYDYVDSDDDGDDGVSGASSDDENASMKKVHDTDEKSTNKRDRVGRINFSGRKDFDSDVDKDAKSNDKGMDVSNDESDADDEEADEIDEHMADADEEDQENASLSQMLNRKVDDDISKGAAVKAQLELWDKLMETRIKLQKFLQLSNKHPQHDLLSDFKSASGIHLSNAQGNAKVALKEVMDKLLSLQDLLYSKNKETANIMTGATSEKTINESDEEIPSDTDEEIESNSQNKSKEFNGSATNKNNTSNPLILTRKKKTKMTLSEYEEEISKRHQTFQDFKDKTIAKWDEKTKLSSGKLRSKTFAAFDRSAVSQIKQILTDKDRLIKRTQLKRNVYRVLGKPEKQAKLMNEDEMDDVDSHLKNYDSEIFDDSDFYHQLIKELIERKSNISETSDPIAMGRQWLELQRWRRKMKKKIDTKASKGRRIRYSVHPKLVSFMAPMDTATMDDQSRNELYKSLFGNKNVELSR